MLEATNTRLRLEGLLALDGLLTPRGSGRRSAASPPDRQGSTVSGCWPDQNPARKRSTSIAGSPRLSRDGGQLIPAWRHAAATGDREFLGETMERVGVFRMWLREGMTCLAAADRFLTPALLEEIPASRPHPLRGAAPAAAVRRSARAVSDRQAQARRHGAAPRRGLPPGDAHRPPLHGGQFGRSPLPLGPRHQQGRDGGRRAQCSAPAEATLLACGLHISSCISDYQAARFEACRQHGLTALSQMAQGGFRHGEIFVNLHLGMAAMSQGRVEEATSRYAIARRATRDLLRLGRRPRDDQRCTGDRARHRARTAREGHRAAHPDRTDRTARGMAGCRMKPRSPWPPS